MTADPTLQETAKVPWFDSRLWREAVSASDSYGLLLVLVVIDYLLLSVDWTGRLATVVDVTFVGFTAFFGIRTSGVRGPLLRGVIGVAVAAVIGSIIYALVGGDVIKGVALIAGAILLLAIPVAVLYRILQHRQVTAQTILGAICAYVLLGLVFAYADLSVQLISGRFFAQPGTHHEADFVYFSFITMTTVGYGDLSPTVGVPRTMAVTEALVGQVFLVVLVARLVSAYIPRSGEARRQALVRSHAASNPSTSEAAEEKSMTSRSAPSNPVERGVGGPS
jgi:hypothetical protein